MLYNYFVLKLSLRLCGFALYNCFWFYYMRSATSDGFLAGTRYALALWERKDYNKCTMTCVRDKLWIWGHEAGSHNTGWGLPACSRMTPMEGACYLGVPNCIMVTYAGKPEPPFEQYACSLDPLDRAIWSIVGDSSSTRNDESSDLEEVISLAESHPNIRGAIMDDFICAKPGAETFTCRYSTDEIAYFRHRLHAVEPKLDLWVVLYDHQLDLAVNEYLASCDGISFWTGKAEGLSRLEENFNRLEALAPESRITLGCYLWDYGDQKPMPVETMAYQCETGLGWLREGRIEGMIFLASCICDLNLEAVEWTRQWIKEVGKTVL